MSEYNRPKVKDSESIFRHWVLAARFGILIGAVALRHLLQPHANLHHDVTVVKQWGSNTFIRNAINSYGDVYHHHQDDGDGDGDGNGDEQFHRPFALRYGSGQPSDGWNAVKHWSFDTISEVVGDDGNAGIVYLNRTQVANDPLFMYFSEKSPMLESDEFIWEKPNVKRVDMSIRDFCGRVKAMNASDSSFTDNGNHGSSNTRKEFIYWSSQIEHFGDKLNADVTPLDGYKMRDSKEFESVNLWLGSKGVTSSTHYDTYNNFFVQIYGQKKFILASPARWKQLHLFPLTHPSARQTQFDMLDYMRVNDMDTSFFEITLSPGDVLYIPPYWYHRVEAVTDSISVNIWTDSIELEVADSIMSSSVPFENDWNMPKKINAVTTYATQILNMAFDSDDEISLSYIWSNRFAILVKNRNIRDENNDDDAETHEKNRVKPKNNIICGYGLNGDGEQFKDSAEIVATRLRQLLPDLRTTIFFDFVEELALWAVNRNIDSIHLVLDDCINRIGDEEDEDDEL